MRSIIILILASLVIGYACINEIRGLEDPRSEKSLRARIEDYYRCLNERNFEKIVKEFWYREKELSGEEIKEEAEDIGGIATYLRIENNIETIKLKNDVAYVFGEMILFPLAEDGDRYLEIWVFKKGRWYRQQDSISLSEAACKDLPIIFSDVQVETINISTSQISWETDEDVEAEIAFWTDAEAEHPKRVSLTGTKKTHSVILSDLCYGEVYYYVTWAIRDNKRCHSKEGHFTVGGYSNWVKKRDPFIETVIDSKGDNKEALQKIDHDLAKGPGSILLEVDGEIARKIANEGGYAFSIGLSKLQEVDIDNKRLKPAMDSMIPRIKISLTGEFTLRIVAPETKENIEKVKKRCPDCKKNQPIIYDENIFSRSFFYADDYYDYAIRIPRYFVERSTLSEIARKRSLQIEKEEDVIEWLRKKS